MDKQDTNDIKLYYNQHKISDKKKVLKASRKKDLLCILEQR